MPQETGVQSVSPFDLSRYSGLWYEIGRLPLKWEDAAATDITAEYTPQDDGTVTVDNRCLDKNGKPVRTVGTGTPVEGATGQLTVSFLPEFLQWIPFTEGDYWVLDLDDAYQHALVGTPDRENLWILARSPHLDAATEAALLDEAVRQGFDLTDWIRPAQSGSRVTEEMLEA